MGSLIQLKSQARDPVIHLRGKGALEARHLRDEREKILLAKLCVRF